MFSGNDNNAGYQKTKIDNDGFWPDIEVGDFERQRSTPAVTDDTRIAHALVNAMAEVNRQLRTLKRHHKMAGSETAGDVDAPPTLNGKNRLVIQYEGAVFARAKADLLPDFATVQQRDAGENLAERSEETRRELLAESERIIRNMSDMGRATVTLL